MTSLALSLNTIADTDGALGSEDSPDNDLASAYSQSHGEWCGSVEIVSAKVQGRCGPARVETEQEAVS